MGKMPAIVPDCFNLNKPRYFVGAKVIQRNTCTNQSSLSIVKPAQVRDVRVLRQVGRFQISDDYAFPNVADLMNEIDLR